MGVVLPRVAFLNDGSRGFRRWFFKAVGRAALTPC